MDHYDNNSWQQLLSRMVVATIQWSNAVHVDDAAA